jgi:hypothetical protein
MTLMERQAKEAAERAAAREAKKQEEEKEKPAGGLRAPSRLMKPTSASSAAVRANEEKK